MQRATIKFVDQWSDGDIVKTVLGNLKENNINFCVVDKDPQYLIYSAHRNDFAYEGLQQIFYNSPDLIKISIIAENVVPDFNVCDYAIGFDNISFGDRYIRLPYWFVGPAYDWLITSWQPLHKNANEREFCSSIVSNGLWSDPVRDIFLGMLSSAKNVASLGRHLRNDDRMARQSG